jgi:hypothetical protein
VTESEWLAATEPLTMLDFLRSTGRADERSKRAVEIAEQFADGLATWEQLVQAAYDALLLGLPRRVADKLVWYAAHAAYDSARNFTISDCEHPAWSGASGAAIDASAAAWWVAINAFAPGLAFDNGDEVINPMLLPEEMRRAADQASHVENAEQCRLLRCLFGNPFRPSPRIPARVLAWNDACVVKIATAIYEERSFDLMPILADALEDAGCDEAGVLEHLRGGGPHARGCFVLDAILGKG